VAEDDVLEFGEWYGTYDEAGKKIIVGYSGSGDVTLTIYVDKRYFTHLKFSPEKQITRATFDHKTYRGMNYNTLHGYDHWIRRMKKHYRLRVWFKGEKQFEIFSLKGFSKAVNWLHK
jgi:hypothetical protein